jgi:hypothetical protein
VLNHIPVPVDDLLRLGMAKPVADVSSENQGGFSTDSNTPAINGFSHMHDSGTGGVSIVVTEN